MLQCAAVNTVYTSLLSASVAVYANNVHMERVRTHNSRHLAVAGGYIVYMISGRRLFQFACMGTQWLKEAEACSYAPLFMHVTIPCIAIPCPT